MPMHPSLKHYEAELTLLYLGNRTFWSIISHVIIAKHFLYKINWLQVHLVLRKHHLALNFLFNCCKYEAKFTRSVSNLFYKHKPLLYRRDDKLEDER